jgi:subtilisin family serine protease
VTDRPLLCDAGRATTSWAERLSRRSIVVAERADGGHVLVRPDSVLGKAPDPDAEKHLRAEVKRLDITSPTWQRIGDYVLFDIEPERDEDRWTVAPVSRTIERLGERGVKARPNHVYLANAGAMAPLVDHPVMRANADRGRGDRPHATARPAASRGLPRPLRLPGRAQPTVLVLDTGLRVVTRRHQRFPEHPALVDCVELHHPWRTSPARHVVDDDDEAHADHDGMIDVCAGHGTFIAGVVHRICPDARVHVRGVLTSFGDGDDATIESGLRQALKAIAPRAYDVVVLSLGAYTLDDRFPPLAAVIRRVAAGDTVVVASAGNDASPRPCYPAAIPEVVAVGALDGARRAWFSNFGPWVDACAPGVDVVSTYFCDEVDGDGPAATRFDGWASWSGTSFAAPKVAATIAQDMYLNGGTAKDAWRRLSSAGRQRQADLGVVFDVT